MQLYQVHAWTSRLVHAANISQPGTVIYSINLKKHNCKHLSPTQAYMARMTSPSHPTSKFPLLSSHTASAPHMHTLQNDLHCDPNPASVQPHDINAAMTSIAFRQLVPNSTACPPTRGEGEGAQHLPQQSHSLSGRVPVLSVDNSPSRIQHPHHDMQAQILWGCNEPAECSSRHFKSK